MKDLNLFGAIAVLLLSAVFSFAQQIDKSETITKCGNATAETLSLGGASQVVVPPGAGVRTVQILTGAGQIVPASNASPRSDCFKTTFILSRREADEKVKIVAASWNAMTKAQAAKEVLRVYESVVNLVADKEKNLTQVLSNSNGATAIAAP